MFYFAKIMIVNAYFLGLCFGDDVAYAAFTASFLRTRLASEGVVPSEADVDAEVPGWSAPYRIVVTVPSR